MNYTESLQILEKIKSAEKILLNMHHNPDADSVGSAISMARVLQNNFGKKVTILSSTPVPDNLSFVLGDNKPEIIDFHQFDFSGFSLFITLDSSSWSRVSGANDVPQPNIPFVVIDHHDTNTNFGEINLVIPDASANCLVLYNLFSGWGIKMSREIAEPLLLGIMGDTGGLKFPEAGVETYEATLDLMHFADKNKIIYNLYQSYEENHIEVWKALFENITIDHESKFVYSFIPREVLEKNGKPFNAKSELADIFFQSVAGTDFGLVGAEDDGYISVSFRSRTGVDVAKLADALGGGGHKWAAAARVHLPYDQAVEKILETCREYVQKGKN